MQGFEQGIGGYFRSAPGAARVHRLAVQIGQASNIFRRQDMDLLLVQLGDVLHRSLLRDRVPLHGLRQRVGVHNRHVDALQIYEVSDILHRSIPLHRQNPQPIGVVQDSGDVGGDAGVRAAGVPADESDGGVRCLSDLDRIGRGRVGAESRGGAEQRQGRGQAEIPRHMTETSD